MVMEFVDGITLSEYLKSNNEKLPWREALGLLHPVVLSLAQIHKAGIIHRDISPDNVMLTKDGQMKLIDFGAARKMEGNQGKKTVILKRGYTPLEQYQTDGNQGPWSDVYSFCATLYRMISGRKFTDAMAIAGGNARIVSLRELVKDTPAFLDAAIVRGLEPRIADRIQSMEDLESYLYQGKQIKKKINKKRWVAAGIVLGAVCLFSIAFMFLKKQSRVDNIERMSVESDTGTADTFSGDSSSESAEKQEIEENGVTDTDAQYENLADTEDLSYEELENEISGMSPNATSVVIKNGVEQITAGAFRNCVYLESVYIPASVAIIEDGAFEN